MFYDLTGDERPEYVAIGDEILPVIPPRVEAWWVPFVPFFATVLSAVIAAVAVIVAQRPHADIVRRLEALERGRPERIWRLCLASATHGTPNRSADGRHLAEGLGCVPVAEQVEVVEPVPAPQPQQQVGGRARTAASPSAWPDSTTT